MRGTIEQLWQELLEKDDRTSPAEYPDMALITFEEFAASSSHKKEHWQAWAAKRIAINQDAWMYAAKCALGGNLTPLRNRVEIIEAERDAPKKIAASPAFTRETSWLIERGVLGHPCWFVDEVVPGRHGWTHNAAEATRFATKADAEAFPAYRMIANDPAISLTEHVFLSRASIQEANTGRTR